MFIIFKNRLKHFHFKKTTGSQHVNDLIQWHVQEFEKIGASVSDMNDY